jgi:hypothetical protein
MTIIVIIIIIIIYSQKGARNFYILHSVQTGSRAHPVSCLTDCGGSFSGDKVGWA